MCSVEQTSRNLHKHCIYQVSGSNCPVWAKHTLKFSNKKLCESQLYPSWAKRVWHVDEVPSILVSAHEWNPCEKNQIRPAWVISVTGWFDLIFHGKACYVPLDRKYVKLFSLNTSEFWKTSKHYIVAARNHDAASAAYEPKLLPQKNWLENTEATIGILQPATDKQFTSPPLVKRWRENYGLTRVGNCSYKQMGNTLPNAWQGKFFLGSKCFCFQQGHDSGYSCKCHKQDQEKASLSAFLHAWPSSDKWNCQAWNYDV